MRTSAKLGLYGLVLAGLVGGSAAWYSSQKTVTVSVDGSRRHVHTVASTVGGVLKDAKLNVGTHDVVAPSVKSSVHSGSVVELRRGRLLQLNIDGTQREVWTTDATVDQALADLGYGSGRADGVSRSTRLPLTPTQITLVMPKRVTVVVDKKTRVVVTTAGSVSDMLASLNLNVSTTDKVSVPMSTRPTDGMTVVVRRVVMRTQTVSAKIPFKTESMQDTSAYRGHTVVITPGKPGARRVTYQLIYLDGKLVGKRVVWVINGSAPRTQVQKVGTKTPPKTSTGSSGGGSSGGSGGSGSSGGDPTPSGTAQQIGKQLVAAHGWGSGQFGCLVNLWNKESHWNTHAGNPSSGAYGIPQALPGSKMASAGANWHDDATTQIKWGLGYISSRYGTPCAAWAHSQATNWY